MMTYDLRRLTEAYDMSRTSRLMTYAPLKGRKSVSHSQKRIEHTNTPALLRSICSRNQLPVLQRRNVKEKDWRLYATKSGKKGVIL